MFLKILIVLRNLLLTALVLGVLFVAFDWLIMPLYTRHWQSIQVPNVTNISMKAAEKLLASKGLVAVKAETKYDKNFPPGFVLFQNPDGGSQVKKGRRVYLTIGVGKKEVEMPQFVGVSYRDVKFNLERNDLSLGKVVYKNDTFYPEGVVIEQSINSGLTVSNSEKIDLVVSLGPEPTNYIVPNLVGKSRQKAILALQKAGLNLGRITFQQTNKLLPNTVIKQSAKPGSRAVKGESINLIVSKIANVDQQEDFVW